METIDVNKMESEMTEIDLESLMDNALKDFNEKHKNAIQIKVNQFCIEYHKSGNAYKKLLFRKAIENSLKQEMQIKLLKNMNFSLMKEIAGLQ